MTKDVTEGNSQGYNITILIVAINVQSPKRLEGWHRTVSSDTLKYILK
jgi:hypothetical protein